MKIRNIALLTFVFILLFSLSFAVFARYPAQQTEETTKAAEKATVDVVNAINKALDWIFNVSFIDLDVMIITLSVFLVLFIVFADALIQFSPLSRGAAWGVALLLSLIVAVLRLPFIIAVYLLGITATIGVFSIFISLVMVFVMYALLHVILFRKLIPLFRGKETAELKTFIKDIKEIKKTMREK